MLVDLISCVHCTVQQACFSLSVQLAYVVHGSNELQRERCHDELVIVQKALKGERCHDEGALFKKRRKERDRHDEWVIVQKALQGERWPR